MGLCCSYQIETNPGKSIDKITSTEPIIKSGSYKEKVFGNEIDVRPVPLLGENNETTFQKIDVSASSSDIDTKELDKMMKTDDDEDDIDDEVEEDNNDDNIDDEDDQD